MPEDSHDTYEYTGLIAEAWDLLRGDTSGWPDRSFYRDRIAESGEPVLDVGCGTGRLLLDYLQAGIDIDGVDNSPEMLAICREKGASLGLSPTLYEQSMVQLELHRRYRTILVPSSSFLLVTNADDARDTMHRFREHLEPGGALVMPFMLPWTGREPTTVDVKTWHKVGEASRADGSIVRRSTRGRLDLEEQLVHSEDRYEVIIGGEVALTEHHRRSPAERWYNQQQSREMFDEAGFENLEVYSEFTTKPADPDDRIWTIVGHRGG